MGKWKIEFNGKKFNPEPSQVAIWEWGLTKFLIFAWGSSILSIPKFRNKFRERQFPSAKSLQSRLWTFLRIIQELLWECWSLPSFPGRNFSLISKQGRTGWAWNFSGSRRIAGSGGGSWDGGGAGPGAGTAAKSDPGRSQGAQTGKNQVKKYG